jgi:multimeric flavodoxin WrbA
MKAAAPATFPLPEAGPACLVLSCSPRVGGNSDTAAGLFCSAFAQGGEEARPFGGVPATGADAPKHGGARTLFLRDYAVSPCTACDACGRAARDLKARHSVLSLRTLVETTPFPCPAAARDDSPALLSALAETEQLCLVSPVYCYHLPAQLKALLDRMQLFWSMRERGRLRHRGPKRPCRVILIGGRSKGARLFAGSLLSLKYALAAMHLATVEPLLLYGLDEADALRGNRAAAERVGAYGLAAGSATPKENTGPPGAEPPAVGNDSRGAIHGGRHPPTDSVESQSQL